VTTDALLQAVRSAIRAFAEPKTWNRLQDRGMKSDVSWERSAARYVELYSRLLAARSDKQPSDD
jgi:starch synthase